MICVVCVNRIEKGLKKVEGVYEVNVNFVFEKIKIMYDLIKINL